MRIQVLTAENVRNLRPLTLTPRERFNVFVGDNGQGKTNLLEAIYAVAALRSFRTSKLADLIVFGAPEARIGARVLKDELIRVYEVTLGSTGRRVLLDGKAASRSRSTSAASTSSCSRPKISHCRAAHPLTVD